jgi:hypothetical protein
MTKFSFKFFQPNYSRVEGIKRLIINNQLKYTAQHRWHHEYNEGFPQEEQVLP